MDERTTKVPGAASGAAMHPALAVLVGHLWCSIPSTVLFLAAVWFSKAFTDPAHMSWIPLIVGMLAGWIWWALMVPRWRQWALRHGAPEERTRILAKRTFLNWPTEEEVERFRGSPRQRK